MSAVKVIVFLVIGTVFWYLAALLLKMQGAVLLTGGWEHYATFAVLALISPPFTWIVAKLTATPVTQMVAPMAIMIGIATLLDGLAITWAPQLYGGTGPLLAPAAASILWGAGCLLVSALVMSRTT